MDAPAPQSRVVVWHPRGRPPRPELIAALSRPGLREVRCDSAYAAMAHLCAIRGSLAPRPSEHSILLVVEPDRLDEVTEVIDIVARFSPPRGVWVYDPSTPTRLRAVTATDLADWKPRTPEPAPKEPPACVAEPVPGVLRLAGEGVLPPERTPVTPSDVPDPHPDVKPAPAPRVEAPPRLKSPLPAPSVPEPRMAPPSTQLLSDEELAMLLADGRESHI